VDLHIVNVSRLSPLELEGVQMPHGHGDEMALRMLPATFWTSLKEGDILFLDEFLRGFPEVYSGLLDIFTSRRVGAFRLPKVFMMAASNSTVAYDRALEDRILHLTVPDPRKSSKERTRIGQIIVDALGLMPSMANSSEMSLLVDNEILPTYDLLDTFKKKGVKVTSSNSHLEGISVRKLIGMTQLREVTSAYMKELIEQNNFHAMRENKPQYVLLLNGGKGVPNGYRTAASKLSGNPRLSPVQATNLEINLQILELAEAKKETEEDE
jgi:hypothetical protein